jgi:uncharacterized SAM-binding protein YcdF (DUF218 family)
MSSPPTVQCGSASDDRGKDIPMQCLKRCLLAFLAVFGTLAALAAGAAVFASDWLNDPDAPARAAAILVLGGDPSRALQAAELYAKGFAPRVYISAPVRDPTLRRLDAIGVAVPREEDLTRQALVARGVPDAAIELLGRDLTSTVHEARLARERLAAVPGALLIVTSPYHIHRARMAFRDEMPGRTLLFVGNRHEPFRRAWWRDQTTARNVVLELAKSAYYVAGGRF